MWKKTLLPIILGLVVCAVAARFYGAQCQPFTSTQYVTTQRPGFSG
jgi:uncharacterized membrane-anchored protein YhcB (DUF1043 family)